MPKTTFHHLPKLKRQKITEAIQTVFIEKPMSKISVTDIVTEANIPRGSFYQYFDDLDDVFSYLFDTALSAFETDVHARLKEKQYPFFVYLKLSFERDYHFFTHTSYHKILVKFFQHNPIYTIDFDAYRKRRRAFYEKVIGLLDITALKSLSHERITHLYHYLQQMKMQLIQKSFKHRLDYEEAKTEFHWFIDVIASGIKENAS
ncbi:MAG: TetR/AcrR family transcriptional regulator [Bacillota bacterium]